MSIELLTLRLTKTSDQKENIAMTAQYNELIAQASQQLAMLLLQNLSPDDRAQVLQVDRAAATVLRQIGQQSVELVYAELSRRVTEEAEAQGLTVQRRPLVSFQVLFGCIQVESPYLWSRGAAARPVKEQLGITHGGRTPAVERALVDFGSEESFAQAATRFAQHYGWEIGRSSVRRVVESVAEEAAARRRAAIGAVACRVRLSVGRASGCHSTAGGTRRM
jgi:hypothetical protein